MRSLSRVIKAGQSIPAPPVFVGRRFDLADDPPSPAPPKSTEKERPKESAAEEQPPEDSGGAEEKAKEKQPPKAPAAPPPAEQAAKILAEASEKARQIIESAQSYSARLTQEAGEQMEHEAASVRKRAYAEGYAQGLERGKTDGLAAGRRSGSEEAHKAAEAENRKYVQELGRMVETVEETKTRILEDFRNDLQDLAVAIAKAILKREIETDEKTLRSIIVNAMDAYRNQEWVRIYVPSESAAVLMKADNNIVKALQDVSDNVKVIPTDGMDQGACVIEMPDKVIDAGVNSQLRKIKLSIEDAMRAQAQ